MTLAGQRPCVQFGEGWHLNSFEIAAHCCNRRYRRRYFYYLLRFSPNPHIPTPIGWWGWWGFVWSGVNPHWGSLGIFWGWGFAKQILTLTDTFGMFQLDQSIDRSLE